MLDKLTTPPDGVRCVADYQAYARARVPTTVWEYLQEGAGEQGSLKANEAAFERIGLMPRPLSDVRGGHTRLSLFGMALEHPVLLAPVAYQRLFHAYGECASAVAANAQGGQMVVSSLASQRLEEIIQAADQPLWFQLYWQGDRATTLALAQRALDAGYAVVVMTVDAPVKQATIRLPEGVSAVNLAQPQREPVCPPGGSVVFDGWMAGAPTWDDVAWLRAQITVPFVLKGILHPDDAAHALAIGCDGLVVSGHGGRVLDGAPASLDALPSIAALVGGRVPVLLDSGVRSGRDVFKALALGATAVLAGRPYVWGLAAAGAVGVAHTIRILRDELEMTMALTGCASLQAIDADKIVSG